MITQKSFLKNKNKFIVDANGKLIGRIYIKDNIWYLTGDNIAAGNPTQMVEYLNSKHYKFSAKDFYKSSIAAKHFNLKALAGSVFSALDEVKDLVEGDLVRTDETISFVFEVIASEHGGIESAFTFFGEKNIGEKADSEFADEALQEYADKIAFELEKFCYLAPGVNLGFGWEEGSFNLFLYVDWEMYKDEIEMTNPKRLRGQRFTSKEDQELIKQGRLAYGKGMPCPAGFPPAYRHGWNEAREDYLNQVQRIDENKEKEIKLNPKLSKTLKAQGMLAKERMKHHDSEIKKLREFEEYKNEEFMVFWKKHPKLTWNEAIKKFHSTKKNPCYRKNTGEADQDYDTEMYDAIVHELKKHGYKARHKEFDKYQGVYIDVFTHGGVGTKATFWTKDVFFTGKVKPSKAKWKEAFLIDSEGNEGSAIRGDYFHLKPDYIFKNAELHLVDFHEKEKIIKSPKVKDLPDLLDVQRTIEFEGLKNIVVNFTPDDKDEIINVDMREDYKNVNIDEMLDYLKSAKNPRGIKKRASVMVWDNGGKTMDRYTVAIEDPYSGFHLFNMSVNADQPNGVNTYAGHFRAFTPDKEWGKRIALGSLGKGVLKAIEQRKEMIMKDKPSIIGGSRREDISQAIREIDTEKYYYQINLDERGEFYAHVEDENGKEIMSIKTNDAGSLDLIDDGYMKHARDVLGLERYLKDMGLIPTDAELIMRVKQ